MRAQFRHVWASLSFSWLQSVAMYCSALQCAAVRCSALQCVAARCSALQRTAARCTVLHYTALFACFGVVFLRRCDFDALPFRDPALCVVACCSVLQRCHHMLQHFVCMCSNPCVCHFWSVRVFSARLFFVATQKSSGELSSHTGWRRSQDALSCRSLSAKESLIIALVCGK